MHSPTNPPISKYGIAYADNLYALAELVNNQVKKGYQPSLQSGVQMLPQGDEIVFAQVMVQYGTQKKTASRALKAKSK